MGYTSGAWNGAGPPATARSLVGKLCAEFPYYYLPSAVGSHSRHYMPSGVLDNGREKTALVFDTWVRPDDEDMTVAWKDVRLEKAELSLLDDLVQRLNYLGRSESWVEGRVMGEGEPAPETNCFPDPHDAIPSHSWEQITLLAPATASNFSTWRGKQLERALAKLPFPDGRKPSKALLRKREIAVAPYPDDLPDCLQKITRWWRSHGWSRPPGSQRVSYRRSSDAIAVGAPRMRRTAPTEHHVQAMLLAPTNASRNDHALPPVTRTLPQADLLRRALLNNATRQGTPPARAHGMRRGRPAASRTA